MFFIVKSFVFKGVVKIWAKARWNMGPLTHG